MEENSAAIRILIVDDHPVVRSGLASMLSTQAGLLVVGSAPSGKEALALLDSVTADIILVDLRMPDMSGVETIRAIKARGCKAHMIVLTSFETDEDIYRAVEAGARGYLLKDTSQEEIAEAIRNLNANKRHLPPAIASRLAERMARTNLTPRELQILEMLAKGLTNKEIGRDIAPRN